MSADVCPHAPSCLPCPYRGVGYRDQLARKRHRVAAAVAAYPTLSTIEIEDVVGSRDLFGYRSVAKLAVRRARDGSLRAGVYAPGTHRVVDAERCAVQQPAISEVLVAAIQEAPRFGIEAYDERRGTGELRYLVARWSAWKRRVLLVLVTAKRDDSRLRELTRRLGRRAPVLGGVVHNYNAEPGNVILGRHYATLRAPDTVVERFGAIEIEASAGSFLQVNPWTARRIYETALEWAAPTRDDDVVDLFCGVGPLALHLATRAKLVVGIEEAPSAIHDARENQRRNRLYNARFEQGRAEDVLPRVRERLPKAAVVTLNPTRRGASPAVLAGLVALEPERIVYVSCDAGTLARDLDRLAGLGYRARRLRPFDMLPQTEHVEIVALVEKKNAPL